MSKAKAATKKAPPKIDKPKKAPAKLAPKRAKVDHTHASPDDEVEHLQAHPFHEHGGPFTIEQTEDRFVITGKRPQPPLPVKPLRND
jgi:hypothetical protein